MKVVRLPTRLSKQVPEVKTSIAEGKLSLSNAAKLESFFSHEKKAGRGQTVDQKRETIRSVEKMSQNACEKKLFQISPQFEVTQKESLRPVSAEQSSLRVVLDSKTVEDLNLLKDRLAHQFPNASYGELIGFLIQDKLEQIERKKRGDGKVSRGVGEKRTKESCGGESNSASKTTVSGATSGVASCSKEERREASVSFPMSFRGADEGGLVSATAAAEVPTGAKGRGPGQLAGSDVGAKREQKLKWEQGRELKGAQKLKWE